MRSLLTLAPLALAVLSFGAFGRAIPYAQPDEVSTTSPANRLVSVDLDQDGDVDLVAAETRGVVWYSRESDGSYTASVINPGSTLTAAYDLAVSDLDHDGDQDIVAVGTSAGSNVVPWFENDGNETFVARNVAASAPFTGPVGVRVADMDRDGWDDVVVIGGAGVRVYQSQPNGGTPSRVFAASYTLAHASPWGLHVADVDGDGLQDIVVVALNSDAGVADVSLFQNTGTVGSGWFNRTDLATGLAGATTTTVLDWDKDGDQDIVVGAYGDYNNDGAGDKVVLYRQAAGVFGSAIALAPDTSGWGGVTDVKVADLDLDGRQDIVAAVNGDGAVRWVENTGATTGAIHSISSGQAALHGIAVADLDADGLVDIATAQSSTKRTAILWNRDLHQESFLAPQSSIATENGGRYYIGQGDIDRNGSPDLMFSRFSNSGGVAAVRVEVVERMGDTFVTATGPEIPAPTGAGFGVLADMDRDGREDIVIAILNGTARYYRNLGAKVFDWANPVILSGNDFYFYGVAGDINRDGIDDVAFARFDGIDLFVSTAPGIHVRIALEMPGNRICVEPVLLDSDGDGDTDVLCAANESLVVFENDGTGGFLAVPRSASGLHFYGSDAIDVNRDGKTDLVTIGSNNSNSTNARLYWFDGVDWSLQSSLTPSLGSTPTISHVGVGDVNRDGWPDFISANEAYAHLTTGSAPLEWFDPDEIATAFEIIDATLADVDSDGWEDVVFESNSLAYWRNTKHGQFAVATDSPASESGLPGGGLAAILTFELSHLGRSADEPLQLRQVIVDLRNGANTGNLSAAQVGNLFAGFQLRADVNGNGVFDSADPVVGSISTANSYHLVFGDINGSGASIPFSELARTFFVVGDVKANAHTQSPNTFQAILRLAGASGDRMQGIVRLRDANDPAGTTTDYPLTMLPAEDFATGQIQVTPPILVFQDGFEG